MAFGNRTHKGAYEFLKSANTGSMAQGVPLEIKESLGEKVIATTDLKPMILESLSIDDNLSVPAMNEKISVGDGDLEQALGKLVHDNFVHVEIKGDNSEEYSLTDLGKRAARYIKLAER